MELDSFENYRDYASDDWRSFKNQFSSLTNSVVWNVVEKSSDVFLIKKAITWSEASLKVKKITIII